MTLYEDPQAVWRHADTALTTAVTHLRHTATPHTRITALTTAGHACQTMARIHRTVFGDYPLHDGRDRAEGYAWMGTLYLLLADAETAAATHQPRTMTTSVLEPDLGRWLNGIAAGDLSGVDLAMELWYAAAPIAGIWAAGQVFTDFPTYHTRPLRRTVRRLARLFSAATVAAVISGFLLCHGTVSASTAATISLFLVIVSAATIAGATIIDLIHHHTNPRPDKAGEDQPQPLVRRDWRSW